MKGKNVRFWAFVNLSLVKLTLAPGQKISTFRGGPTEEGFHREWEEWEHDGEMVEYTFETDGRDCDGRVASHHRSVCPIDRLAKGNPAPIPVRVRTAQGYCDKYVDHPTIRYPDWVPAAQYQRDYAAEAAGY